MEVAGAVVAHEAISTTAEAGVMAAVAVPTLPLKATFERFTAVGAQPEAFYRKNHTLTVVFGRAYVFGGVETHPTHPTISAKPTDASLSQTTTTEKFCSADFHILTLPQFLHSLGVPDYQVIPPVPKEEGGEVPSPRKGHLVAVDGDDLVLFGGTNEKGEKIPSNEVWRFNTNSLTWCREQDQAKATAIAKRSGLDTEADTRATVVNDYEYKIEHAQDGFASVVSWRKPNSSDQEPGEGPEWASKELPKNPLAPGPAPRTQDTESAPAGAVSSDTTTTTNPDNDYIIPLTTGQGRNYLAFLFTLSAPDIWALQVHSAPSSLTSLKDKLRNWMEWDSGFLSWAKVEIQVKDVEVGKEVMEAEGKSLPGRMEDYAVERVNLGGKPGAECMILGGVDAVGRGCGEVWIVRFE